MKPNQTTPEQTFEKNVFEIGLVMAGAVSAGAYTAGIIDYFLEAMESWEDARANGKPNVPKHQVRIKVISGASAGGMVAAITAAELLRRQEAKSNGQATTYKDSLLYNAWVNQIDIDPLLDTKDLDGNKPIYSLLNTDSFEQIADSIILNNGNPRQYLPLPPYIDPKLKMYLTLSNLRGLPYEFRLKGESGLPYGMTDHADYQFFVLCEGTRESDWYKLRNAAIATGAFPVGLKARLIERDTSEYATRIAKSGLEISGKIKLNTGQATAYPFVAVDGGALNNEPIELARSVWTPELITKNQSQLPDDVGNEETAQARETNEETSKEVGEFRLYEKDYMTAGKNALIIIDPFPNFADAGKPSTIKDTRLSSILLPLISALRAQSLFKPEEMIMASDADNFTRFLIAPVRRNKEDMIAPQSLACGFFGGFGGFLSRDFREHDYILGRRNAQRFLTHYFVFPQELIDALATGKVVNTMEEVDKTKDFIPMIPMIEGSETANIQGEDNEWPSYSKERYESLKTKLNKRICKLTERLPVIGNFSTTRVKVIIGVLALLIALGEWGKYSSCDREFLIPFLNGMYILVIQLILGFIMIVMVLLMLSKSVIDNKLTRKSVKYVKNLLMEWGIPIKEK